MKINEYEIKSMDIELKLFNGVTFEPKRCIVEISRYGNIYQVTIGIVNADIRPIVNGFERKDIIYTKFSNDNPDIIIRDFAKWYNYGVIRGLQNDTN